MLGSSNIDFHERRGVSFPLKWYDMINLFLKVRYITVHIYMSLMALIIFVKKIYFNLINILSRIKTNIICNLSVVNSYFDLINYVIRKSMLFTYFILKNPVKVNVFSYNYLSYFTVSYMF